MKSHTVLVHFFRYCVIACILFSIFSFQCPAPNSLTDDDANEVYQKLHRQWKPVEYKQPLGFETIFALDRSLWPALPESYEWRIEQGGVRLFKHKLALDHKFDFVTYPTDSLDRFSFLSRWDGVTHHSFAYPRIPPLSDSEPFRVYPMRPFPGYMNGHCIDLIDTYGISDQSRLLSGARIESISTLDPRNYIPEPLHSYWGLTIRKEFVQRIRKRRGCYAQYMYYGDIPSRLTNEETTAIPRGIYFLDIEERRLPRASYHILWEHAIHKENINDWKTRLRTVRAPHDFFPSPFVHDLEAEKIDFTAWSLPNEVDSLPSVHPASDRFAEYYKIIRAADHEVLNPSGKVMQCYRLLFKTYPSDQIEVFGRQTETWLERLCEHAVILDEMESKGIFEFEMDPLFKKLRSSEHIDKDNRFLDFLKQLYANDTEGKGTAKALSLAVPRATLSSSTAPIPIIDMDYYSDRGKKSPTEGVNAVVAQLKKDPRLRLLNMQTVRAQRIASAINAEFPTPAVRARLTIEYTPSQRPRSKTAHILSELKNTGATVSKVEPQASSPTPSSQAAASASSTPSTPAILLRPRRLLMDSFSPTRQSEPETASLTRLAQLSLKESPSEKGRREGIRYIAKKMRDKGMPMKLIVEITGLSADEILSISSDP